MEEKLKPSTFSNCWVDDLLNNYALRLKALMRSQKTIDWYADILREYYGFLSDNNMLKPIEQLGSQELNAYLLYLQERDRWPNNKYIKDKGKLSPFSIQGVVRAIKAFWNTLLKDGIISENPLAKFPLPKVPKNLIQTITVANMKTLLNAVDKSTPEGERLFCILLTFIDTGTRIGETVVIKITEVDFQQRIITVTGKGQKQREVPFSSRTRKALIKFKDGSRNKLCNVESDYLFPDKYGNHLTIGSVQQAVRRLAKKVGVECHPHLFRHTFGTTFIANGGSPSALKEILGHESFHTTQKYIHLKAEDLKLQHEKYSPIKDIFKDD